MAFELLVVPAEDREGITLAELAESLTGFPEIERTSEMTWRARVQGGAVLRMLGEIAGQSADLASEKIASLDIEAPTPLKDTDARALFSLAFAVAARLDWRVFEAEILGQYLEPARLDFWVREFAGICNEPEATRVDAGIAAIVQLSLPLVIVAAAASFALPAAALVYLDVREPWLGWLILAFGMLMFCGLLTLIGALRTRRKKANQRSINARREGRSPN